MIEAGRLFVTGAQRDPGPAFVQLVRDFGAARIRAAAGRAEVRIGPLSNEVQARLLADPAGFARERALLLP